MSLACKFPADQPSIFVFNLCLKIEGEISLKLLGSTCLSGLPAQIQFFVYAACLNISYCFAPVPRIPLGSENFEKIFPVQDNLRVLIRIHILFQERKI